ncbi:MAG TPA: polyprenyl diphosphate synthase [Terriglobales bacterium]|nr:polyprenyl diphosphate synthase [Terriglobales bacterium]
MSEESLAATTEATVLAEQATTTVSASLPAGGEHAAAAPAESQAALPRHIAIIMDGNGRWAAARQEPRWAGHRAGIAAVRRTVEETRRLGVPVVTLYAFSTENWKRSSVEVSALWELLSRFLVCERAELREKGIRLVGIGRRDRLPLGPRTALELTERLTSGGRDMLLRLAIDYGSQWAIAEAARRLARQVAAGKLSADEIDEARLSAALLNGPGEEPLPAPDLLIRTGGETRLSNFMLWECAYAELWFTPTLWPDFERATLAEALADFARRKRRYGA